MTVMRKYSGVKKNMFFRPDIIAIAVILCALAYALLVHTMAPSETWSWWHTFVATIVSIVFAGAIGIALFNYQTKISDDARRQQLRSLLATELFYIIEVLDKGKPFTINFTPSNTTVNVIITYIPPHIIEKAAQSGLFSPSETASLLLLVRKIILYNTNVGYLYSSFSSGAPNFNFEKFTRATIQNIDKFRKATLDNSKSLMKQMSLTASTSPEKD